MCLTSSLWSRDRALLNRTRFHKGSRGCIEMMDPEKTLQYWQAIYHYKMLHSAFQLHIKHYIGRKLKSLLSIKNQFYVIMIDN